LDSGECGINYLKQIEIANVCKSTIHFPDNKEYKLLSYCIMPNHVHLVFELLQGNKGISKIMQSVKGISAFECNKILFRKGKFWQDESFDRWVRDDKELFFIIRYILLNPVKAGLVKNWYEWENTYCHPDYIAL
jgi:REP element-mobilizing transposase RayT